MVAHRQDLYCVLELSVYGFSRDDTDLRGSHSSGSPVSS